MSIHTEQALTPQTLQTIISSLQKEPLDKPLSIQAKAVIQDGTLTIRVTLLNEHNSAKEYIDTFKSELESKEPIEAVKWREILGLQAEMFMLINDLKKTQFVCDFLEQLEKTAPQAFSKLQIKPCILEEGIIPDEKSFSPEEVKPFLAKCWDDYLLAIDDRFRTLAFFKQQASGDLVNPPSKDEYGNYPDLIRYRLPEAPGFVGSHTPMRLISFYITNEEFGKIRKSKYPDPKNLTAARMTENHSKGFKLLYNSFGKKCLLALATLSVNSQWSKFLSDYIARAIESGEESKNIRATFENQISSDLKFYDNFSEANTRTIVNVRGEDAVKKITKLLKDSENSKKCNFNINDLAKYYVDSNNYLNSYHPQELPNARLEFNKFCAELPNLINKASDAQQDKRLIGSRFLSACIFRQASHNLSTGLDDWSIIDSVQSLIEPILMTESIPTLGWKVYLDKLITLEEIQRNIDNKSWDNSDLDLTKPLILSSQGYVQLQIDSLSLAVIANKIDSGRTIIESEFQKNWEAISLAETKAEKYNFSDEKLLQITKLKRDLLLLEKIRNESKENYSDDIEAKIKTAREYISSFTKETSELAQKRGTTYQYNEDEWSKLVEYSESLITKNINAVSDHIIHPYDWHKFITINDLDETDLNWLGILDNEPDRKPLINAIDWPVDLKHGHYIKDGVVCVLQ
jgi:hypothetical protein